MPDNRPIGVFDSGIGGLTLVSGLARALPQERFLFFGDTAHLPYGDKSSKAVITYSQGILQFFARQGCKAVIIACNTASAVAYSYLERLWADSMAVFNVIDPVVRHCVDHLQASRIGVIGTKSTIRSRVYPRKFQQLASSVKVTTASAPLLAPMIEEGFYDNTISRTLIGAYLDKKQFQDIEALILGCTHYPLIRQEIEEYFSGRVSVVDNIQPTISAVSQKLADRDRLADQKKAGANAPAHHFFVSDFTQSFQETARIFFGASVELEQSDIWRLSTYS
jgi:glutamate racemase